MARSNTRARRLAGRAAIWALAAVPICSSVQPVFAEPVVVIRSTGSSTNRVDVVILGDGYAVADQAKFASDAQTFTQGLFAQEPLHEYENYFNVRRVDVISPQSGADHPERTPPVSVNTALDAAYNCGGIQR